MSKVRNRKRLSAGMWNCSGVVLRCRHSTDLRANSIHAAYCPRPDSLPHIGGNSFEGPKDVVYLPTRPPEDTRLNMYFGDWHDSEPHAMFGALVVRDILLPGDNLSPPFPGHVLEHAKFLSYGRLEAGERTSSLNPERDTDLFLRAGGRG